eukprot:1159506-Pelagomonas_calceolata.AAC.10
MTFHCNQQFGRFECMVEFGSEQCLAGMCLSWTVCFGPAAPDISVLPFPALPLAAAAAAAAAAPTLHPATATWSQLDHPSSRSLGLMITWLSPLRSCSRLSICDGISASRPPCLLSCHSNCTLVYPEGTFKERCLAWVAPTPMKHILHSLHLCSACAGGAVGGSSLRHSQGFPAAQDPPKNGTLNPHVYAMNIFYTCTHANSKSKTHDPSLVFSAGGLTLPSQKAQAMQPTLPQAYLTHEV